jgi:hypothetical protein
MNNSLIKVPVERIEKAIYLIRREKVMLDRDLAELYGVQTKILKQAVRRNIGRFPGDFMFVLNASEFQDWRSQFVTSAADRKGLRYPPMAFTEQGVAMLSSAPAPVPTASTSYPRDRKSGVSARRIATSSSTSRMRAGLVMEP